MFLWKYFSFLQSNMSMCLLVCSGWCKLVLILCNCALKQIMKLPVTSSCSPDMPCHLSHSLECFYVAPCYTVYICILNCVFFQLDFLEVSWHSPTGLQQKYLVVKGKVHTTIGHVVPEGEYRYSSTLSLSLALDGVGGHHHAPATLPSKGPGTEAGCAPEIVSMGAENFSHTRIRSPDHPAHSKSNIWLYQMTNSASLFSNTMLCQWIQNARHRLSHTLY
jgi:hypothetical protein